MLTAISVAKECGMTGYGDQIISVNITSPCGDSDASIEYLLEEGDLPSEQFFKTVTRL